MSTSRYEFITYFRRGYPPSKKIALSFAKADSILNAWGFNEYYNEQSETCLKISESNVSSK
jgi:hypothetical protein